MTDKREFPIRMVPGVWDEDDEQVTPEQYVVMHLADSPNTVYRDMCSTDKHTKAMLIAAALDLFTNGPRPETAAVAIATQQIVELRQKIVEKDNTILQLTVERDRALRERDHVGDALVDKMVEIPPFDWKQHHVTVSVPPEMAFYPLDDDAAARADDAADERAAQAEAAEEPDNRHPIEWIYDGDDEILG
jgi:hypothetical protein